MFVFYPVGDCYRLPMAIPIASLLSHWITTFLGQIPRTITNASITIESPSNHHRFSCLFHQISPLKSSFFLVKLSDLPRNPHFWCRKSPRGIRGRPEVPAAPAPFGAAAPAASRPPTRRGAVRLGGGWSSPWSPGWFHPTKNGGKSMEDPWLMMKSISSVEIHRLVRSETRHGMNIGSQEKEMWISGAKMCAVSPSEAGMAALAHSKNLCSVIFRSSWESLDSRKTPAGQHLLYSPNLLDRPVNFAFNKCSEKMANSAS